MSEAPIGAGPCRRVAVSELAPGAVVAEPILDGTGATLLAEGSRLTAHLIELLAQRGVGQVTVLATAAPAAPAAVPAAERRAQLKALIARALGPALAAPGMGELCERVIGFRLGQADPLAAPPPAPVAAAAIRAESLDSLMLVREIPPLAPTVMRVLEAMVLPSVDFCAVEREIALEPGVAARVLQLANSPFFGLPGRIHHLREAFIVLGSQTLRQVVLAAAALARLGGSPDAESELLWRHSVAVAAGARVLADRLGLDADVAAAGGLLHDLGRLALHARARDSLGAVRRHQTAAGVSATVAEQALLGFDHSFLGGELARKWRLPDPLVAIIAGHHQPDAWGDGLVDVIHLVDVAADTLLASFGEPVQVNPATPAVLTRLSCGWRWLDRALPGMAAAMAANPPLIAEA